MRTSRREITRRDFLHGARIAVTGAAAWTDVAIDQAHRAVGELLGEAGA